jgi:hypothetical protein
MSPIVFATGTRTFSKKKSPVSEPRFPILSRSW